MQTAHSGNHNSYSNNQGKLMSISSIIASSSNPCYKDEKRISLPGHPYNHPHHFPLFRSPPASPEPSSPSSLSSSPRHSMCSLQQKSTDDEEDREASSAPLTLEERRLRNKAASAKYRQKKSQQHSEMKYMISKLSEQNAVLERQLQELRLENERLKATSDRLRGKMVARKMLKKWIGKQASASDNMVCSYNQQQQQHYQQYGDRLSYLCHLPSNSPLNTELSSNMIDISNSEQEDDVDDVDLSSD
ncbi:hypothetical protein RMATCC62417_01310 [Rhizopus microsporus]|nr:hypothetical protein RMATCC62417_01310 [Rhizopus microsporus]